MANCTQQYVKKIIHHDPEVFILGIEGWYNICKLINVIYHINKRKDKNHMVITIDVEKAFDTVHHPFMIKNTQQSGNRQRIPEGDKSHI